MARVGYIRVSSSDQHVDRQLSDIKLDKIFTEYASGRDKRRAELENMINYIREGDDLFIHSMDRLARTLADLRNLVDCFISKGVAVHFVKEGLNFTGDDTPMDNLMLSIIGSVAEFERSLIHERQAEGIKLAKQRGVYKGRKKVLDSEHIDSIVNDINAGVSKSKVAKKNKISRTTLYKYINNMEEK